MGLFDFFKKNPQTVDNQVEEQEPLSKKETEDDATISSNLGGPISGVEQALSAPVFRTCELCGTVTTTLSTVYVSGDDTSMVCAACKEKVLSERREKQEKLKRESALRCNRSSPDVDAVPVDSYAKDEPDNSPESRTSVMDHFHIGDLKAELKKAKDKNALNDAEINELKEAEKEKAATIEFLESTIKEYSKRIEEYELLLTPDHKKALDSKRILEDLTLRKRKTREEIAEAKAKLNQLYDEVREQQKKVHLLSDQIMMEDFGLYEPTYHFASLDQYKDKLKSIRDAQKAMVRMGTAAFCNTPWTVNGSSSLGNQMTKNQIKQALMIFNLDCENAVNAAKFNNITALESRIEVLFYKVNTMNVVNEVEISREYMDLKIQELRVAYEYQVAKQEEKERVRQAREAAREAKKVAQEIEAERRRIAKEQQHYENAKRKLDEQLVLEKDPERIEELNRKKEEIMDNLDDLAVALQDVDYREANERAGYVYVISNIGAFGEGVYKIGMTRRLNPYDRIDELGGASVPFRFDVHTMIFTADAPKLEHALHEAFADRRVNMVNSRKEFLGALWMRSSRSSERTMIRWLISGTLRTLSSIGKP